MRITRFVCRLALPIGILLGGLNAAGAAPVSDEARQACTPDAMRLCSQFIPDAARVRTCMLARRSELSKACRVAMRGGRRVRGQRYYHRVVRVRYVRHHHHYRRYHHYDHHR